jgi:hypothetical protein
MQKKYCLALLLSVSVGVSVAWADQNSVASGNAEVAAVTDQTMFEFGSYGTLGATHASLNSADYALDAPMPYGSGRSGYLAPNDNSLIAAHVNATFSPDLTAIFQVISEYNSNGNYRPEVEWANVKYAFTPDFYIKAGRFALPTFMDSDNHDVGYSFVWVHTPVELYQQMPITSVDGVNAVYRFPLGETVNTVKLIAGQNTTETSLGIINSRNMRGVFDNLDYGQTTFHMGYQQRSTSTQSELAGLNTGWVEASDLSAGISYDPGSWFFKSEWLQDRGLYKTNAMYASAGYRMHQFTPYLTHSQSSAAAAYGNSAPYLNMAQKTNSAGVRWDFMKNFDLKVQYDHIKLGDNSNGYLVNVPDNAVLSGKAFHVISAVVDFVF